MFNICIRVYISVLALLLFGINLVYAVPNNLPYIGTAWSDDICLEDQMSKSVMRTGFCRIRSDTG